MSTRENRHLTTCTKDLTKHAKNKEKPKVKIVDKDNEKPKMLANHANAEGDVVTDGVGVGVTSDE